MTDECGLTLPPTASPMHSSERESYLGWAEEGSRRSVTRASVAGARLRCVDISLLRFAADVAHP